MNNRNSNKREEGAEHGRAQQPSRGNESCFHPAQQQRISLARVIDSHQWSIRSRCIHLSTDSSSTSQIVSLFFPWEESLLHLATLIPNESDEHPSPDVNRVTLVEYANGDRSWYRGARSPTSSSPFPLRTMDVFKIDQSLSAGLGSAPAPDTLTPEVSFDAGSEFNLSFFDGPEENSTQGFSDPGSVGSASASPPPGTPASIPVNPSNAALPIVQVPPGIVIKQVSHNII
ncbi:hypothetical protein WN51_11052 [Melipona quadrifasciata]|uniref:Uncharacterized protein n=1 Tax=Melipona quadrifasciata TaxID=166423 RepID=A0A0M9A3W8_9HYME|nr:hypothetical protein WN51_11052 [Melipona quadrifasciata]